MASHFLFLNLAGNMVRRRRSIHACPRCALLSIDLDAIYCKACGQLLQIPDPGN